MPRRQEVAELVDKIEHYLCEVLLPFWIERAPDRKFGGFLTYIDRDGLPTGETEKSLLMQVRMIYSMASAHRAGYGGGRCGELAEMGLEFLLTHFWDDEFQGWYWLTDRRGRPLIRDKIGYGHCLALYALSEHFLATGDRRSKRAAEQTYAAIGSFMADTRHGGYHEMLTREWELRAQGLHGGDRKSLDVHMHMMEALTSYYEMTGEPGPRRRLLEVIDLLIDRMLHPESKTGYMQFTPDFTPLPAILFEVTWGRDARPTDDIERPLDCTSYGHNVEFAWLLLHAATRLGISPATYAQSVRKIFDHCLDFGIDDEYGGVYVEGPHTAATSLTEKQFWQQAEVLVGMLDAVILFRKEKYWYAFRNVLDFTFDRFVNLAGGGEWYERLDRQGHPIDSALGHAWKINYHTVRSMIQCVKRLRLVLATAGMPAAKTGSL